VKSEEGEEVFKKRDSLVPGGQLGDGGGLAASLQANHHDDVALASLWLPWSHSRIQQSYEFIMDNLNGEKRQKERSYTGNRARPDIRSDAPSRVEEKHEVQENKPF
jgi:hypothetical protein